MIGTRSGIRGMLEFYDKRDKQISQECDAQEVYFYEYNNHECCYGWEGDAPAYELIVDYFGEDIAKTIKRIWVFQIKTSQDRAGLKDLPYLCIKLQSSFNQLKLEIWKKN